MERWKKMLRQIGILYILAWLFVPVWGQEIESVTQPVGIGIFEEAFRYIDSGTEPLNASPTVKDVTYDQATNRYEIRIDPVVKGEFVTKNTAQLKKRFSGSFVASVKYTFSCLDLGYRIRMSVRSPQTERRKENIMECMTRYWGVRNIKRTSFIFQDEKMGWSSSDDLIPLTGTRNETVYFRIIHYDDLKQGVCEFSYDGSVWNRKLFHLSLGDERYLSLFVDCSHPTTFGVEDLRIEPLRFVYGNRRVERIDDLTARVSIELTNPTSKSRRIEVKECVVGDLLIDQLSHDAKINYGTSPIEEKQLLWNLLAPVGKTKLEYTIHSKEFPDTPLSLFNGLVQDQLIVGASDYLFQSVNEQTEEMLHWRSWTATDGLPDSSIRYLNVGSSENLYLMNYNLNQEIPVLNRFDGYAFHPITLASEFRDGFVLEALDGSLWFYHEWILYQQKINEKGEFSWEKCMGKDGKPFLVTNQITPSFLHCDGFEIGANTAKYRLIPMSTKKIYCLHSNHLLCYNPLTRDETVIREANDTPLQSFQHMILSKDNNLWITGDCGVIKIGLEEPGYPILEQYILPPDSILKEFTFPIEGSQDNLLVLANNPNQTPGRYFAMVDKKITPMALGFGIPLSFADDGWAWMLGIIGGGIEEYIARCKPTMKRILPQTSVQITNFSRDYDTGKNGTFWIGSEYGLLRYAPPLWRKPAELQDIQDKISTITEDESGTIWAINSTFLLKFDGKKWIRYPKPIKLTYLRNNTHSIVILEDGRLMINTGVPINDPKPYCLFDPVKETFDFETHPNQLNCDTIFMGKKHPLIMVLYRWELDQIQTQIDYYDTGNFHTLVHPNEGLKMGVLGGAELENGDILIGSNSDEPLQWFHEGKKRSFTGNQCYPGSTVFSILEINQDQLWVGDSNSIYEYDGDRWTLVRSNLNRIYSMIQAMDGSIWVASWTGLHRYKEGCWITFNGDDGFRNQLINQVFEDSQGRIWVGAADGIYLFHPEIDQDPPQTVIHPEENSQDFSYNGEVHITFSGIDRWKYTPMDQLLYSYRLNDQPWSVFVRKSKASYKSIPPGQYTLHVRSMDKNWNIDPTPATYDFRVNHVPIQARSWFVPLVIGIFGLILTLAVIALRSRSQLAQFAGNLETMVQERTQQLRETEGHLLQVSEYEQQRIGQDLHDDVVQDLVGIALHQEILLRYLQPLVPEKLQDVQDILQQVDQATQKTRSLAKGLAPVNLEQLGLLGALQSMASTIEDYYSIHCVVEGDLDAELPLRHHHLALFRIVQEAINNAVKHAEARQVRVNVQKPDHKIVISIVDDGNGFDTHERAEGMGLQIMRYRAKNIGADLQIESKIGKGTLITCILPINV